MNVIGQHKKQRRYTPLNVNIVPSQEQKLKKAISHRKGSSIKFIVGGNNSGFDTNTATLLFTPKQVQKINAAKSGMQMKMFFSPAQIQHNSKHEGGFLSLLASLIIPIVASAASAGITHAITKGNGFEPVRVKNNSLKKEKCCSKTKNTMVNKIDCPTSNTDGGQCMIFHTKDGEYIKVTPEKGGDGLWLRPYGSRVSIKDQKYFRKNGQGLYLKKSRGSGIEKLGDGLAFGVY